MDLFKTKQSQDITKQRKRKKTRKMIKSFENIFVTYLIFLAISNQPHKLLTVSLVGGGLLLVCLLGLGSKAPGASVLGLQGIKPYSLLTLWCVVRPH